MYNMNNKKTFSTFASNNDTLVGDDLNFEIDRQIALVQKQSKKAVPIAEPTLETKQLLGLLKQTSSPPKY